MVITIDGPAGAGKTTIARLLARAVNLPDPAKDLGGLRDEDTAGQPLDLIEIDGASNRGIDEIRQLRSNANVRPSRSRFKIYIIDEVHMLSLAAFNALLKTLEEPPPHVKFLLATTDPQKLPATVLSRCLQFNLKRMTPRLISDRLEYICDAESIEADAKALATIARAADGSMRDALSLLDQAIAFCGGRIEEPLVAKMLGTIDRDHVVRLLRLLAKPRYSSSTSRD